MRKLILGIADGKVLCDNKIVFEAFDIRVGLFKISLIKFMGKNMSDIKRVVITGMGIVSSIGNNVEEVKESLINQKSGIVKSDIYKEMGFRSQIHGTVKINIEEHIDKKQLRFMGAGAAYTVLSMEQAIKDAGLTDAEVSNPKTGLIAGSGGPSTANMLQSFDIAREKGPKRVGPLWFQDV